MKKLIIAVLAALAIPCAVFGQASVGTGSTQGNYSSIPLSLPPGLILTGTAAWAYPASTNLVNGWSVQTITTNITQVWQPAASPPAFSYVTNFYTNTVTTYAQFQATMSRYTALQIEATATAQSNLVLTIAKSVTGSLFDTTAADELLVTNVNAGAASGQTNAVDFLADMGGYGYGRVVNLTWQDNNTGHTWTNTANWYSQKQGAAQ